MPFNNPFKRNDPDAAVSEAAADPANAATAPNKSAAELIAESLKPLTDTLTGVSTTLQAVNQRLEAVETATKRPPKTENTAGPTKVSVFDDEEAFAAQTVAPVLLKQYELEATLSRDRVRQEYERKGYGEVWAAFEDQINAALAQTPLVRQNNEGAWVAWRGDPASIRNTVNMIFGQAAIAANVKFGGKDKGFFLETTTSGETGGNGTPAGDGLREDQRRVFARMKGPDGKPISADAIKATMSKLKFVN